MASKRKYETTFKASYTQEYPTIIGSRKGNAYAFCAVCRSDFSILHGGKNDILKHLNTKKHKDYVHDVGQNKKLDFCFPEKNDAVIRAESYFTAFIIEHNLPISCADHAGQLFRKMFPDSEIAKKYGCARTKTTAIIGEMGEMEKESIVGILQKSPFSIATDGSNKSDSKLYPMVVSYNDEKTNKIETTLLSVPVLEGDGTGSNIANLVLDTLKSCNIPLQNCLALGADNAPVMVGMKTGVAGSLKKEMENLVVIGCNCHLINLAAEKGAACLPVKVDEYLVDIYFYLERSSKRKDKLKVLQSMHDTEVKKILKHVSTRWLSLGRCLNRLIQQWEPLASLFKDEVKSCNNEVSSLKYYQIPKKAKISISEAKPTTLPKATATQPEAAVKRKSDSGNILPNTSNANSVLSREERLFMFLSSDLNKAFCLFLLNAIPIFEEPNVKLQSSIPHIHILRSILFDMLRSLFSRFVLPSAVKSCEKLLKVAYSIRENQKNDSDLVIGHSAAKVVEKLREKEKALFFDTVRKYFVTVCDYMVNKFPFKNDILLNAEVATIALIEKSSFSNVRFFLEKFPVLLGLFTDKDSDTSMDILQSQFCALQVEDIPKEILIEKRIDTQWSHIGKLTDCGGALKFDLLSKVMLAILTIPHGNAECERVFSLVTKTHTQFRSALSIKTMESLLTVKSRMQGLCFSQEFSQSFLKRAKSATVNSLMKE